MLELENEVNGKTKKTEKNLIKLVSYEKATVNKGGIYCTFASLPFNRT
jgi:hypothetical protein